MKRTMTTLGALMLATTPVLAAGGPETAGSGLLTVVFMVFGALIIVGQLIPGLVLFYSMVKGLYGKVAKKAAAEAVFKTS